MDWNIQSRSRFCSICQRRFVNKQPYQTVLYDRGVDGYLREDLCMECHQAHPFEAESAEHGKYISHWQGVFQTPPPQTTDNIAHRDTVEILLRKIVELNDRHYINVAYVLAAKLERERVLKVKDVHYNGVHKITLYEHTKTADVFAIEDPNLQLSQLDDVQREVCDLLEQGLPPEAEATLRQRHSSLASPIGGDENSNLFDSEPKSEPQNEP